MCEELHATFERLAINKVSNNILEKLIKLQLKFLVIIFKIQFNLEHVQCKSKHTLSQRF
jgi:hypothetical protein